MASNNADTLAWISDEDDPLELERRLRIARMTAPMPHDDDEITPAQLSRFLSTARRLTPRRHPDYMQIEPAKAKDAAHFCNIYFVVDTNAILQYFDWLLSIIPVFAKEHIVVIVPSVVMDELDGLKNGAEELGARVRRISRQLYDLLRREDRSIRGQVVTRAMLSDFPASATNDEKILACCVWLMKTARVALFTSDVNLKVKALAQGIPAVGSEDIDRARNDDAIDPFIDSLYNETVHQTY